MHADRRAGALAREANAAALTSGRDIWFGAGQYRPHTKKGASLLAHELTHAAQQGFATRSPIVARQPLGDTAEQWVPRPSGLPLDTGFVLQPADLDPDTVAELPEGQLVDISQIDFGTLALRGIEGLGGSGLQSNIVPAMRLGRAGFTQGLQNTIGLVAVPPNPGHTAVFVRQGGVITHVRGYMPRLDQLLLRHRTNYGAVFRGEVAVPGRIANDASMFFKQSAQSIEYPVAAEIAEQFAKDMPRPGRPAVGQPQLYSAPPATHAARTGVQVGCEVTNCGLWAPGRMEEVLGGRVGVAGETPMTDIGKSGQVVPGSARQGKVMDTIGRIGQNAEAAPMKGATGRPVVGVAPRGLNLLKYGGQVFFVIGASATVLDIALAPAEERGRRAAGGIAGFAGGFVGGAALGL
ncbi:MAG: DUF4157 domain-containing protein, partial [Myxococcota bacterium]